MESHCYNLVAASLLAISVLGASFNSLVIALFVRNRKLWTRQNVLILSLACADLLMAIGGLIPPLISSLYHEWIYNQVGCQIEAFVCSFVGIGTKGILVLLAIDRYRMVRNRTSRAQIHGSNPVICLPSVWISALIITCPPLFGWGNFSIERPGINCSVDWESPTANSLSYIVFLMLIGFVIPLIIIITCYTGIYLTLHQTKNIQIPSRVSRAESRVTLMVAAMIVTFLIAWVPYALMALIKIIAAVRGSPSPVGDSMILCLPVLLAKSSIIYNPIIYAVCNTQFREAWRQLFRCSSRPEPSVFVTRVPSRKTG